MVLGDILGKDTTILTTSNKQNNILTSSINDMANIKKENDILKLELNKSRKETAKTLKHCEFAKLKCDLIFQHLCQ